MQNQQTKELEELKKTDNKLKLHVINYILDYSDMGYDKPSEMITDILSIGCSNGAIGYLTYYVDTAKFFNEFYDEIEELRIGGTLKIKGDLKNCLAWFGFEEMLKIIANDLNLEI